MTTKHTPGPWSAGNKASGFCFIYAGTDPNNCNGKGVSGPVARTCGHLKPDHEANANLIAAAPELLEALIELDQWAQSTIDGVYEAGTFQVVQAAIAKAKGETA